MLRRHAQRWGRGLAALLVLAGLLLAARSGPAAPVHDTAVAVSAAPADAPRPPRQPGELHGTPCCQANACTTLAAPAPATEAVIEPATLGVIIFAPMRSQRIAGIAPHPGMRPPRAAV